MNKLLISIVLIFTTLSSFAQESLQKPSNNLGKWGVEYNTYYSPEVGLPVMLSFSAVRHFDWNSRVVNGDLGFGVGFLTAKLAIPVRFRVNINIPTRGFATPFFSLETGVALARYSYCQLTPMVGVSFKLPQQGSIYAGVGCMLMAFIQGGVQEPLHINTLKVGYRF